MEISEKSMMDLQINIDTQIVEKYKTYDIELEITSYGMDSTNDSYVPDHIALKLEIKRDPVQVFSIIGIIILIVIIVVFIIRKIRKRRSGFVKKD